MRTSIKTGMALLLFNIGALAFAQSLGWKQIVPGAANDIGVGPKGEVWVIGNDRGGNDYGIYRRDGANWTKIPGGAVRIDVGPTGPWVVNNAGGIYRYNGSSWDQVPGGAKDIGIGANGTVWVIGGNAEVGGWDIYRYTGSGWQKIPGSAVRIDVDPQGNAWVVTKGNSIFRYDGTQFVQVPGAALDIGIGANGAVYVVGTDNAVYHWSGSTWVKKDGILTHVSADHQGKAWGVNPSKQIWAATAGMAGITTVTPPPPPPPPPAPPRKGITGVNNSKSYSWFTVYLVTTAATMAVHKEIKTAACLAPGQETSWHYALTAPGNSSSKYVVRVERTSTPNCASRPNNAHVTCDTSGEFERLGGLEVVTRLPYVRFEFNDNCGVDVTPGR